MRAPAMLARPTLRIRLTRAGDVVLCAWWAFYVGVIAAIVPLVLAFALSVPWLALVLCPPVFLAAAALTLAQTVLVFLEIGADGVALRRGILRRFVSYERIRRISLETGAGFRGAVLRLGLGGSRSLDLRVESLSSDETQRVLERLHLEISAHRAAGAAADLEALDRRGRSVPEWRRALSGIFARSGGYRGSPLTREAVSLALDDVAAAPERRIAAALVLVEAQDEPPGVKDRIRGIARASADIALREALIQIADGEVDDGAVDRATAPRA